MKLDAFQQTGRMLCFCLYRKRLQKYHCCIGFSNSKQNKECICLLLLFGTHVLPWISLKHLHCPRWTKGASKQSTSRCVCIRLHQSLYIFVSLVSPVSCFNLSSHFCCKTLPNWPIALSRSLSQPHGDALLEQARRLSNTLPVVFLYLRRPSATSSIEVFFAFRMEQAERGNKTSNVCKKLKTLFLNEIWRKKTTGGCKAYSNCRSYGRVRLTIWEVCVTRRHTLDPKKTPTWQAGHPGCQRLRPFNGQSCEISASLIFRKPCFVETNKFAQRRAQIGKHWAQAQFHKKFVAQFHRELKLNPVWTRSPCEFTSKPLDDVCTRVAWFYRGNW